MPLTDQQISLVQQTFERIYPLAKHIAEIFYSKLFKLDPSLRALFPDDMLAQQRKLMQMLAAIVTHLDQKEIMLTIHTLGQRHADYGVAPENYGTMQEALLWTLGQSLGDDFTPEVKDAWTAAFAFVSTIAIAGMPRNEN